MGVHVPMNIEYGFRTKSIAQAYELQAYNMQ
jgi:hypothetical protein